MAVCPDKNIQSILRKHQASLPGWEPALSLRVPGTPWGGISCWARLGCPAQGSLLWPPLQAGSVLSSLLPASFWEPHPLREERCCKQTSAPQPPCILPVAAPRCQPALLTAGAAAGTAGFVLAEASEPVEAGVRIWVGLFFCPRVCAASQGEFLLFFHASSAPSSKILGFSESQPSELKLCIFHVF